MGPEETRGKGAKPLLLAHPNAALATQASKFPAGVSERVTAPLAEVVA